MGVPNTLLSPVKLISAQKSGCTNICSTVTKEGLLSSMDSSSQRDKVESRTSGSSETLESHPSTGTLSTRPSKRVSFGISSENTFASSSCPSSRNAVVYTIPNRDMDDHQRSTLWWTKEERRVIRSRNNAILQDYIKRHPLHVQYLQQVFDEDCCRPLTTTSSRPDHLTVVTSEEDEDGTTDSTTFSSSDDSDDEKTEQCDESFTDSRRLKRSRRRRSPMHVSCRKRQRLQTLRGNVQPNKMNLPTCVRGLEYGILPDAKAHRKIHCKRVLDCQNRLQESLKTIPVPSSAAVHEASSILEQQSAQSSHRSRHLAQLLAISDAATLDDNNDHTSFGGPVETQTSEVVDATMLPAWRLHREAPGHSCIATFRPTRPRMMPSSMW